MRRSLAVACALALAGALAACGTDTGKAAGPAPVAVSSPAAAAQSPTTAPADTAETLALKAGQSDTALAQDFTVKLAKWNNAGGDTVFAYSKTTQGQTVEQTAAEYSKKQQQPYIDALFDKASISKPDVATFINTLAAANSKTLVYDQLTDPSLGDSKERMHVFMDLYSPVERVSSEGGSRTLRFTVKGYSNYKDTYYHDKQTDSDDILYNEYTVSFAPEDGAEKITGISVTRHK